MGCRNQGSKKSKKSTGGPRVRVPLSLSGWSTGPRGACPPAVLLHILRISSGSSLFSSSSSAIVMTGAPEPACDSIEMPDGACNARPAGALESWGPDKGRSRDRTVWNRPGSCRLPPPLPSRSAPVRLFPRFSLAPRRMPPSTGASGPGRSSACPSHLSPAFVRQPVSQVGATHVVLCTYDPISSPLLRLRAPHCARRPLDLRGATDCCRPTLRSEIER